ncbi:GTPase-associated system all-helical protein GASH [Bradyrhizobium sp. JYMT SZCCT0428]|uniref:GTPase-associated system all-helical protein GASH n=1 Tax=Bradyrhizobium sp. JYMT SZCCT0428 TaxID=2807673 RepID=UPI001BA6CB48|nr:GTPase-associated system all-helical protein GASH [Bradyrhizobium sp. JYMT SZCCT0428]MBR1154618.1 hypothetical protein [Bradyrhizobium sp. JYMT SZCCT0428]
MTKFDFIVAYRELDAAAAREVVEARQKSFDKLWPTFKHMAQTYELCRLAFLLDPPETLDWFEQPMREFDPHFVMKSDRQEAGRMAALLLRRDMEDGTSYIPLAVLCSSYCGRRHSADDDATTRRAAEAFAAAVRDHRVSDQSKLPSAPKLPAIKAEMDVLNESGANAVPGTAVKDAVAATLASAESGIKALSNNVAESMSGIRFDVTRLAEEVDMLWWHIGDWHELLERPRSETGEAAKMMVSGIELGAMVRQLPGPFGAHGILRRTAGQQADAKTTLRTALKTISQEDAQKLVATVPASVRSLFPVHTAIQMFAAGASWEAEFTKAVPDVASVKISQFELGVQAFRERALIAHGGLG